MEEIQKENDFLVGENKRIQDENDELKEYRDKLKNAQDEIKNMLIDSQANAEEIRELIEEGQNKQDEIEKLRLETTVVITEKFALQKELNRVNAIYGKLQKDFKEQRVQFSLMIDEISGLNKLNSEYRGLILKNE